MIKFLRNNNTFKKLDLKPLLLLLSLFFCGCGLYNDSFRPEILKEKKILSSRKSQIIIDNKTQIVCIVTYLNNVDSELFKDAEYFFIEVFSQLDLPIGFMDFSITNNSRFNWIREVYEDEFDDVINTYNKWSKAYLISFEEIPDQSKKNMQFSIDIAGFGKMDFDFSYKVSEIQF